MVARTTAHHIARALGASPDVEGDLQLRKDDACLLPACAREAVGGGSGASARLS